MAAAVLLGGNAAWCAAASEEMSQEREPEARDASPARIDPADAMAVFSAVEAWVRAGAAPASLPSGSREQDAGLRTALPGLPARAACVTLRADGRVVGRANAVSESEGTGVIYDAAYEAIRLASRRLPRPVVPMDTDAWAGVAVGIEIADRLVPLRAEELAALDGALSPGLDGLAVRLGERTRAVFPGELMERTGGPTSAVTALAGELAADPAAALGTPAELTERGFVLYRFRPTRLAQPRAGLGPVFLHRGGVVRAPLDAGGLRALADAVARHLLTREWPGVEAYGLMGTLDPVAGRYDPPIADPVEQSVMAVALLRYARAPGADPTTAADAGALALRTLRSLARVEADERDPAGDIASAAAGLWAIAELAPAVREGDAEITGLRDRCRDALGGAFDPVSGWHEAVPAGLRGFVALGIVADGLAAGREPAELDPIVRSVFRGTPPEGLMAQMPWLAWAEMALADAAGGGVRSAEALRGLRETVLDHQLRPVDLAADDRDLAGGIVFTRGTSPLPTWHSLRAHALLASMLRRPELTGGTPGGGEFPRELVRVLEGLRFASQLSAGEAECGAFARPDKAIGGVRAAPWDARMPPEASALALLTATEVLAAAERAAESP